jgi:hypothetical protein
MTAIHQRQQHTTKTAPRSNNAHGPAPFHLIISKKANRIDTRLEQLEQPMVVSPLEKFLGASQFAPSMIKQNPPKNTPLSKSKTSGKKAWTTMDPATNMQAATMKMVQHRMMEPLQPSQ